MKGSTTYLNWFRRLLVLGAVVAAGVITASAGAVIPPDGQGQDFATALHQTRAGVIADGLRLQGEAEVYKQLESVQGYPTQQGLTADGLRLQGEAEVYKQLQSAQGYPTEQGLKADGLRLQGEAQVYQQLQDSPDVFERYAAAHPYGRGLSVSSTSTSDGFDWSDWGIGIGVGAGIALILGAGLIMGRQLKHRGVQTA